MSDCQDQGATHPPAADRPGQVLHLADFNPMNPSRIMAEMQAYWDGLRRGRAVPARSDIQPQGIRRALDYAFILERIAPGAARFRLAGQHLIDLMGMEVRGMAFCSLANGSSRGRLSDVLESVFRAPQLAQLTLTAKAEYARPELTAQMLLLPLTSDLGDVTRALGCIIANGQIGVAPRRFDLAGDAVMPILAGGKTLAPSPSNDDRDHGREHGALRDLNPGRGSVAIDPPAKPVSPEARRGAFRVIARPDSPLPVGTTKL